MTGGINSFITEAKSPVTEDGGPETARAATETQRD